jgi:hypothetical protein
LKIKLDRHTLQDWSIENSVKNFNSLKEIRDREDLYELDFWFYSAHENALILVYKLKQANCNPDFDW